MQVEIATNLSAPGAKQYLRVATFGNKTNFCYLYIGNNTGALQLLTENFQKGFNAASFDEAKKLMTAAENIDVIIIDTDYNEKKIREFQSFLKNRNLNRIPVLYNDRYGIDLSCCELVDDVIDLHNWQFDFSSKISFLKKTKEYRLPAIRNRVSPARTPIKRALDILVASVLILLLLPLFAVIAIAIRLESRGPIFYNAKRAGRGFKIFSFYKFRTMVVNADKKIQDLAHLNQYTGSASGATFFKISNDPRITRVGKFLRNTSLDELPQLFNVLKGDMSLVGNRPLPLYEAATLTTNEFVERFMAPAGMTGLWQIKKRGNYEMSAEERINMDISYARNSNLLYDFWIMANTPGALLQKTDV